MQEYNEEIITSENTILAGTKVIDKSGGPNMVIVGFAPNTYEVVNKKFVPKPFARQKVFVNMGRKTIGELNNGIVMSDKKFTYFFFNDIFSEIKIRTYTPSSDMLQIICKYWSEPDNEFFYVNKTLPELEVIAC